MRLTVTQFVELYRQIRGSHRPQGVFIKPNQRVFRVNANCARYREYTARGYDEIYALVGVYNRYVRADWLLDDLAAQGVHIDYDPALGGRAQKHAREALITDTIKIKA